MTDAPHSYRLRLYRDMDVPGTWLVTKTLQPKQLVLISLGLASIIIDALSHHVRNEMIYLGAFVVMPDHWHAVLATSALSRTMHSVSTWIGAKTSEKLHETGTQWQDSYHDMRVRSSRQLKFICRYVEENPVRKGYCVEPAEWVWSSANPAYEQLITKPWPWDFPGDYK